MSTDSSILLEPAKAFREVYKDSFEAKAKAAFDKLLKESGVKVEENRKTAEEFRNADSIAKSIKKRLDGLCTWRVILIMLAVCGGISLFYGLTQNASYLFSLIGGAVLLASVLIVFFILNPRIKTARKEYADADKTARELYNTALMQVTPLLSLFTPSLTLELIGDTLPKLSFDRNFDVRRCDYLTGKYGYVADDGKDTSTLGVLSGEIIGNPFVFERTVTHRMGSQTYTGTLTIHWTTYSYDSKGNRISEEHSETLYAHVTKPKPFYTYETRLIYGCESAPDLSFSRDKTHAERFSENKKKSFVRSRTKKIAKIAEKNAGRGFTALGDNEFDAYFGAFDRNHEVQFRLLFTPLAQKNFMDIIEGGSPYGDDFYMAKRKCINIVASEHAQNRDFDPNPSRYNSYDVDIIRENFMDYNAHYFRSIYFDFAPLLSIPLYQQDKPQEYIYKHSYERNFTVREAEVMANCLGNKTMAHPASVTPAILKTALISRNGGVDCLKVHASSYRTVKKVDYVSVFGGDGYYHEVAVPWLLYIPLCQETTVNLCDTALSDSEYKTSSYAGETGTHTFRRSLFATLGKILDDKDGAPGEKDAADVIGDILEDGGDSFGNLADRLADAVDDD